MGDRSPEEWQAAAEILRRAVEAGNRGDFESFRQHIDSLPDWTRPYIFTPEALAQLVPLALDFMKDQQPEKLFELLKDRPYLQHCFPKEPGDGSS